MAFNYVTIRDGFASRLIADAGQTMTLTRITGSVYDESAGTNVPTTANVEVSGVETEYKDRDIDGTLVLAGDRKVILEGKALAAAGVVPSENDTLTYDGVDHKVVRLRRVAPGGTSIVYKLQVRAT